MDGVDVTARSRVRPPMDPLRPRSTAPAVERSRLIADHSAVEHAPSDVLTRRMNDADVVHRPATGSGGTMDTDAVRVLGIAVHPLTADQIIERMVTTVRAGTRL